MISYKASYTLIEVNYEDSYRELNVPQKSLCLYS
jgi:hypothetical protein